NGDGTLRSPLRTTASVIGTLTAVDVNADGKLDLLIDDQVLFGRGDGTFTVQLLNPMNNASSHMGAADLNGDGRLDVFATFYNTYSEQGVQVYLAQPDGSFAL